METKKFRGKYRIESVRMKNFNYSSNGAYFITIVTKNRENILGGIVDGAMVLSEIGKIVWDEWFVSEKIRDNIFLDQFIVMPNHIHGIVIIDNDRDVASQRLCGNATPQISSQRHYVGIHEQMSKISPKKSSLSHMIRELKSAITRKSRKILPHFAWQPGFYDRIIRNENELNRIRQYIISNPIMWERDSRK